MIINQYDENGEQHGLWIRYFNNGELACKLVFNHGELVGPYIRYMSAGQIEFKGFFSKKKDIGLWYEDKYDD